MYDPGTHVFHRHDHHLNHTYKDKKYQLPQNHESGHISCVEFRPTYHLQEAMESDDSSPPLWNNSLKSPSQTLLHHQNHSSLSPEAQAITRGQWELMEMVKNMPESSYELSLKDLVEHPKIETESQTNQEGERSAANNNEQILHQRGVLMNVKRLQQERKKNENNVMKSGGLETKGVFLNMVFPFPLKSKKKKNFAYYTSGKFSSRSEGIKGGGERDWWKKKFSGSSDSDCSRTSTINTGSSSTTISISISSGGSSSGRSYSITRKKNGLLTGCWPFFSNRRSKSAE